MIAVDRRDVGLAELAVEVGALPEGVSIGAASVVAAEVRQERERAAVSVTPGEWAAWPLPQAEKDRLVSSGKVALR